MPVLYGEGVVARVRAGADGPVDAVRDAVGKTPIEDLISLVSEPSRVTIANFAAGQAGVRVTVAVPTVIQWRPWRKWLICWHRTSW
jgi:NADPH:quinone reductase-like Zn-dependent oxidoreductase